MSASNESRGTYLFILPWTLESCGGVNQVVENLMNQMERHGKYRPLLMVNSWGDTLLREQEIMGYRHFFFRLRSLWDNNNPLRNFLAWFIFLPSALRKLRRFVIQKNVAVINMHYCGLPALNIAILKSLGLFRGKWILSFHGADLLSARQSTGLARLLWKTVLTSADAIVTCSERLKSEIGVFYPENRDRVECIHNGIDNELFFIRRDISCIVDAALLSREYILNIGTFEYKKGQDVLIKAFSIIAQIYPDLDLVLIGRPAESIESIKVLIESLGLGHRVWLYENVPHDKVSTFYEKAKIFVLPSRYEPFGIVLL